MKFGTMKPHRRERLLLILFVLAAAGSSIAFVLMALNDNINLFYSPQQILSGEAPTNRVIRAGGMVLEGSVIRSSKDLEVRFLISDMKGSSVPIVYRGILPDLFREGQGIISKGKLEETGTFIATEVLAKHDENYMPPELAEVLPKTHRKNGEWKVKE